MPSARFSFRALGILFLIAIVVVLIDQIIKNFVSTSMTLYQEIPVLGKLFSLFYITNSGAAFSLGSNSTWVFSIITAVVIIGIIWFSAKIKSLLWATFLGLVLGGALGNLYDRLFRPPSFGLGHVVDYISTPWLVPAVYNLADSAVVCGMGIFAILMIRGIGADGKRESREVKSAEGFEHGAKKNAE